MMPIPENRNSIDTEDSADSNTAHPHTLYVGLMSGTSMDGIDAVVISFGDHSCELVAVRQHPYPETLRKQLATASRNPEDLTVDLLGSLDHWVAECFSGATAALLATASIDQSRIKAIGSHGQTIRHQPRATRRFTMQIGDPNIIAARTGITTVADFRRRDLALGGEGAPLASAFHQWLFADSQQHRAVLNIGGIANVTVLSPRTGITIGFDTGPGNTLLDAWIRENRSEEYDAAGAWAESGNVIQTLLTRLMADPYFCAPPPKSTGFEYFNLEWLQHAMDQCHLTQSVDAADIQATLAEFTAVSIADAIKNHAPKNERLFVCGGGVHNDYLMTRLSENLQGNLVSTTADCGLDPDWVEAAAFAWLAMQTLHELPGNLPSVTGASRPAVLGGIFFGSV